jgi:hypothetical protein
MRNSTSFDPLVLGRHENLGISNFLSTLRICAISYVRDLKIVPQLLQAVRRLVVIAQNIHAEIVF